MAALSGIALGEVGVKVLSAFRIHPEYTSSRDCSSNTVTLSTCPNSGARQGTGETSVTPVEAGTLGHKYYGGECLVRGRAVL